MLAEQLDGVDLGCLRVGGAALVCCGAVGDAASVRKNGAEIFEHEPEENCELDLGKAVPIKKTFLVIAEQQVGDDFFTVAVGIEPGAFSVLAVFKILRAFLKMKFKMF